jgi:hypothetical protein
MIYLLTENLAVNYRISEEAKRHYIKNTQPAPVNLI